MPVKTLFLSAPWYNENEYMIKCGSRWPWIVKAPKPPPETRGLYNPFPFFMMYTAAYLSVSRVADVFVYDAGARNHTYKMFYDVVGEVDPEIVIMEVTTPSIGKDLDIARELKKKGIEIALSGTHASVFADELIKLPYIDYILKGEYEVSSYEMCLMRTKKVYESHRIEHLDSLPSPYLTTDDSIYLYTDTFGFNFSMPQLQVWTSRGCPSRCSFCSWNHTMTNHNYRQRSVKSIGKELTASIRKWKFKSVLFDDDTFNVGDKRVQEMCDFMDKVDINWQAMVKIDACSKHAFGIMRHSGCDGLKIGIETFSQRGLDALNKGGNADRNFETCDYLLDLGYNVFLSCIGNIPGETD